MISRSAWGFDGWNGTPDTVSQSERTEFMIHYDGDVAVGNQTGSQVARNIHAFHKGSRGWAGVGYNFIVTQDGETYEGRGWDLQAAACPGHNRTAWHVQVHIGGNEQPSEAAKQAVRHLYLTACDRRNRNLTILGHRDGYSTDCPGEPLYRWVQQGLTLDKEKPMETHDPRGGQDGGWLLKKGHRDDGGQNLIEIALSNLYKVRNFTINGPAVVGPSLDAGDIGNLADFQRCEGLEVVEGLDWPTYQRLQDPIRGICARSFEAGIEWDVRYVEAMLGWAGFADHWPVLWDGKVGDETRKGVNALYEHAKANGRDLGSGPTLGPKGLSYLISLVPGRCWNIDDPKGEWLTPVAPKPAAGVPTPVPGSYVTAVFGQRPKNRTYWQARGYHTGRDYSTGSAGSPVVAVRDGTVTVRDDRVLGCIAILHADNGRHYWYCHLRRGSRETGPVKAGQQIARVGQTGTGAAMGPHLHFEDASSGTEWGKGLRNPSW